MRTQGPLRRALLAAVLLLLMGCGGRTATSSAPTLPAFPTLPAPSAAAAAPTEEGATLPVGLPVEAVATTDLESTLIQLYERANPATVYIVVPGQGSGSGFVYDHSGILVTNYHVVREARTIEVLFSDGARQRATLLGSDVDADLAVLKVESLPEGVQPLPLAPADGLRVGQFVVAIGNPFGEQGSMSLGIVSGLGRSLASQRQVGTASTYSLPEVVQTDAPINPGNSGGPLLNLLGEVVGINAAIASTSGSNSGVGFAIPVAAIHRIVPTLIAQGDYDYAYLGASFDGEVTLDDQRLYGLSQTRGAYVLGIAPNSPAAQAGLRAADTSTGQGGDLIIAIDGAPIEDFGALNSYLVFNSAPGQTIQLTVVRDGQAVQIPLTLGARP